MSVTPNFCCDETKNRGAYTRLTVLWLSKGIYPVVGLLGHMVVLVLVFKESPYCSP